MTGRTVAVIGFGVTGRAVASHLRARGDEVVVFDDRPGAGPTGAAEAAEAIGVTVERTPSDEAELAGRLAGVALVVPSPGVPVGHPVYGAAGRAGVPVVSEIELASEIAAERPGTQLVAITGTNGKTTVTTLVTAMLNDAGLPAVAAGNIGLPLIEAVQGDHRVVVAEVSSFQLWFTERFRPSISCWLNLAPDHLDWHPDLDHYAAAKARIWANQGTGDVAVYNADDEAVSSRARSIPDGVERLTWSTRHPASFQLGGGNLLAPDGAVITAVADLPRSLPHDVSNSLAAAAVAMSAGATRDACRSALGRTGPLPHRVSLVAEAGGVGWYDDSKATTPASVLAAVSGFASVVLIAGGRNKGLDLGVLSQGVPPIRAVVGIGEAAGEVAEALGSLVAVSTAASMEAAVAAAAAVARPGDAVLLSPGCASFDWYGSYSERGDHFAAVVRRLLEKGGAQC